MAITITQGHTFTSGQVVTPTRLNSVGTISITAPADTLLGAVSSGAVTTVSCTSAGRALLDDADAAAQRTTLELNSMAQQAADAVAVTGGTVKVPYYAATPSTLTYDPATVVEFSSSAPSLQTITLTGSVAFTSSNLSAGAVKALRIIPGASNRSVTFPAWKFVGQAAPTAFLANKTARINLESWGTTDADVVAIFAVEQ